MFNKRKKSQHNHQVILQDQQSPRKLKYNFLLLFCLHHLRSFMLSLGQVFRTPVASTMTLLVIGIAMAMPLGLYIFLDNLQGLAHRWQDSNQISLFLTMDAKQSDVQSLQRALQARPDITAVRYISPAEGLATMKQQTDFGNVLEALDQNPLPGVLIVTPNLIDPSGQALNQLLSALQRLPQVDKAQLDMVWVKRLHALLQLGNQAVYLLAALLSLGVLLIIGNTIDLVTQKYQCDIRVYKLMGASDRFVRRPFVYAGALMGGLGAMVACALVYAALQWLQPFTQQLAQLYGISYQLIGLNHTTGFYLMAIGMGLGLIGAQMAVNRHLRLL